MNSTITISSPYDAMGTFAQSSTNTFTLTIKNHCANSTKVSIVQSESELADKTYTLTTPAETFAPFGAAYSKSGDSSNLCGTVTLRGNYEGAAFASGDPVSWAGGGTTNMIIESSDATLIDAEKDYAIVAFWENYPVDTYTDAD